MNQHSEARLNEVHPKLAEKVRQLAVQLAIEEIQLEVTQGLRSWDEQQKLYDQGRRNPGRIVTKCPPGWSYHNFGLAVDVCPFVDGQPEWDDTQAAWKRIHEVARSLGLTTGADFPHFPDYPHLQLTGTFPVNPTAEVRQLFKDGNCQAVWEQAQLA